MGEVVSVTEFMHDPVPPELVNCLDDNIVVEVARLRQQIECEIRPDCSRQAGHLPRRHCCLLEPLAQYSREVTGRHGRAAEIDRTAHCLDDVQREPSRRSVKELSLGLGQGVPGDRSGEMLLCAPGVQRVEGKEAP